MALNFSTGQKKASVDLSATWYAMSCTLVLLEAGELGTLGVDVLFALYVFVPVL